MVFELRLKIFRNTIKSTLFLFIQSEILILQMYEFSLFRQAYFSTVFNGVVRHFDKLSASLGSLIVVRLRSLTVPVYINMPVML